MSVRYIFLALLCAGLFSCRTGGHNANSTQNYPQVHIVGALRNVMQKGELQGRIQLDTIANRRGLYGLGPEAFLSGELLIYDGRSYVSRVQADSSIQIDQSYHVSAPFFVYTNVEKWKRIHLPSELRTIKDLEQHLEEITSEYQEAFPFRLSGTASSAAFHIQNLPEGTAVRSPQEAHQGQVNYELIEKEVEILGFFSKVHQGIFTHHDSHVHMHMITRDGTQMGHLDTLELGTMQLLLPAE